MVALSSYLALAIALDVSYFGGMSDEQKNTENDKPTPQPEKAPEPPPQKAPEPGPDTRIQDLNYATKLDGFNKADEKEKKD